MAQREPTHLCPTDETAAGIVARVQDHPATQVATAPTGLVRLTAAITSEDSGYVARCLEADVVSQGDTIEEATKNLIEAVELHFEGEEIELDATPTIVPIDVNFYGMEQPGPTLTR